MLIENSKGNIVEVTEDKWEELRSHGFSTWKVVKGMTSLPNEEKAKPIKIELDKPLDVLPEGVKGIYGTIGVTGIRGESGTREVGKKKSSNQ